MEAPLDRGERQPQEARDPLQRHLGPVAQREDELELLRQGGHRLTHPFLLLAPFQSAPAGVGQDLAVIEDQLVQRRVGSSRLAAVVADRLAPRDHMQPRGEPLPVGQLRQRLERQQERFLADVFRQLAPGDLPAHRRQHRRPVAQDEHVERRDLPQQGGHDQRLVLELLPLLDRHRAPSRPHDQPPLRSQRALAVPASGPAARSSLRPVFVALTV